MVRKIITLYVWTISAATSILLHNGNQTSFAIEKYLTKIDPNCTITRDRASIAKHYIEMYMLATGSVKI